jgi:hypothetical protein
MNKAQRKTTHNTKPRIDEVIADRNPLQRLKVTPVDLYQVPQPAAGEAVAIQPQHESSEAGGNRAAMPSASETVGTRTPDTSTAATGEVEARAVAEEDVVLPYSTRIRRSLIRAIRVSAFKTTRKDRQIVEAALEEYFENHSD